MTTDTCPVKDCPDLAGGLCADHARKAARALRQLPELYVKLSLGVTPHAADGDHVTTSRELKVPINLAARALQDDIVRTVAHAEADWRGVRDTDLPARGRQSVRLAGHVTFLLAHLAAMLDDPIGVQLALDVMRLRRRAIRALGLDRVVERIGGTCPTCGDDRALHHDDGADHILCHACGRVVSEDEYERLGLRLGRAA